jgi:DNA-binding CsgD family transcriptional regulator
MRQNRITSIANQGVSAKHIAIFMNIDVKTALNYIRPSEEDIIKSCLIA